MRAYQQKKKNKTTIVILVIVLIAIAVSATYVIIFKPFSASNTESDRQQTQQDTTDEKDSSNDSTSPTTDTDPQTSVDEKTPSQYEGEAPEEDVVDQDNDRFRIPEGEE